MPKYQLQINGTNFLVAIEGQVGKCGFFTFRHVEAETPDEAGHKAMEMLRQHQPLRDMVQNEESDPPEMHVTEIAGLDSFDEVEEMEPGFIWYNDNQE